MKVMQSGIDFFGEGMDATRGCSCICDPTGYATAESGGISHDGCGCRCGCPIAEIKVDILTEAQLDALNWV